MDAADIEAAHDAKQTSLIWLGASLAYFVAAASTIFLTSNGRDVATIWPANAILVTMLLLDPTPRWRTVLSAGFVGNLAANLITRGTVVGPLLYGAANLVEVALVVLLLRKPCRGGGILESRSTVARFIFVAGILAPGVSGVIGGSTAFGFYGQPLGKSVFTWIVSDGLGLVVFTPFFFALLRGDFVAWLKQKSWAERAGAAALLTMIGLVAIYVFYSSPRPLLFAIFPPLMLITFRLGRLGTKSGVMMVAIIGGVATMHGHGPITLLAPDATARAQFFQFFLAVTLLTCLPAAAEVSARTKLTAALAEHGHQMAMVALRDPLTGALNRAGIEAEARRLLIASPIVSVILIDFDHFKQINDRWGHQAGDRALRHVVGLLQSLLRAHDLVGRIGGDEFVVLLPGSDLDVAAGVGDRIQTGVRSAPLAIDDTHVALIGLSMGMASRRPGEGYDDLMRRADRALYEAKAAGRGTLRRAG